MTARWTPSAGADLSIQELQVLRLMAENLTYRQIAKAMHVSEDTAKTYGVRLFRKLDVSSRFDAVMTGIRQGLLPCPCGKEVAA